LSIEELEATSGPNGKNIIAELRAAVKQNPETLELKDIENGMCVCFKGTDVEVELMQLWGSAGNENANTIESKLQYITKKVYLDNGERNRISFMLQHAQFKPVPGQHGSFKLDFSENSTTKFDKVELSRLKDAVIELAKITKAARNRSWK
jgi:hypothetical protein